jgi:hypothetical protein
LEQFIKPFSGFNGTNLYVEGIAPGSNTLSWSYSEQSDCVDTIRATVFRVSITPSSMAAIESLDSAAFTCVVTPSGLSPSYQWLSGSANDAWPSTAGNNPTLDYSAPSSPSTFIQSTRWYAPTPSRQQVVDGIICYYKINCEVTIGGQSVKAFNPAILSVEVNMTGLTEGPVFQNWNSILVGQSGGVWRVTGQGGFSRSAPIASVNMPSTSQFYSKAMVHENKHVAQWTSELPWMNLFDANGLFNTVLSGLTSTVSEAALRSNIFAAIVVRHHADMAIFNLNICAMEDGAFDAMNIVAPDFLELDEADWSPLYGCP